MRGLEFRAILPQLMARYAVWILYERAIAPPWVVLLRSGVSAQMWAKGNAC